VRVCVYILVEWWSGGVVAWWRVVGIWEF